MSGKRDPELRKYFFGMSAGFNILASSGKVINSSGFINKYDKSRKNKKSD
jgi:hypothetical protein